MGKQNALQTAQPYPPDAVGADYGSGLPLDFSGTFPEALAEYGLQVANRMNFALDRVKPNFSLTALLGAEPCTQGKVAVRVQFDAANLNAGLILINFAGLFSGNSVAPPSSYRTRLKTDF
jgi:hypothetical protein